LTNKQQPAEELQNEEEDEKEEGQRQTFESSENLI
jgi:hypothetical protein